MVAAAATTVAVVTAMVPSAAAGSRTVAKSSGTPIKHLVVIFQENVSFDHYFGTYPRATNSSGQPFHGGGHSGSVNSLINTAGVGGKGNLLTNNPNREAGGNQVNPRRLDPANINDILTCDQDHGYADEQQAFHGSADGKTAAMDQFITSVGTGSGNSPTGQPCQAGDVMNYYDGNTVTGLWNYASQFAMSDNSFGTTFGPSSPGAINLAAGTTGGVDKMINGADTDGDTVPDGTGGRTLIDDAQPYYDDCSARDAASLSGRNIGNNLNAAGLSWGWFQGGFRPSTSFATATGGTQPPALSYPTSSRGSSPSSRRPTRVSAIRCTRLASRSAGSAGRWPVPTTTATRMTTSRITSRSSTTPRPPTRTTCHRPRSRPSALIRRPRSAACRNSTRPTTSTT